MSKQPKQPEVRITDDQDEIASCDVIVCVRAPDGQPLLLPDNKMGFCSKCDAKVQYRPYLPPGPALLCHECAIPEMEATLAKGEEVVSLITPQALEEVRRWISKQRKE